MTEFKVYKTPWKAIKLLLGCALFVLLGLFILRQPDAPVWVGWASILFFGMGIPVALFQLLDRRPQIIVNEVGIFDRTIHKDFINWEIIQDAYLAKVHEEKFICLVVNEAFEPSRRKGKVHQQIAGLSKAMGFQELNINLSFVNIDAERLTEFILAMRRAEKPDRTTLIRKRLRSKV